MHPIKNLKVIQARMIESCFDALLDPLDLDPLNLPQHANYRALNHRFFIFNKY